MAKSKPRRAKSTKKTKKTGARKSPARKPAKRRATSRKPAKKTAARRKPAKKAAARRRKNPTPRKRAASRRRRPNPKKVIEQTGGGKRRAAARLNDGSRWAKKSWWNRITGKKIRGNPTGNVVDIASRRKPRVPGPSAGMVPLAVDSVSETMEIERTGRSRGKGAARAKPAGAKALKKIIAKHSKDIAELKKDNKSTKSAITSIKKDNKSLHARLTKRLGAGKKR